MGVHARQRLDQRGAGGEAEAAGKGIERSVGRDEDRHIGARVVERRRQVGVSIVSAVLHRPTSLHAERASDGLRRLPFRALALLP